jgi:hypothetical protein
MMFIAPHMSPIPGTLLPISDSAFRALQAQAYPEVLDRETGAPWYIRELAKRDAEIAALRARIAELQKPAA